MLGNMLSAWNREVARVTGSFVELNLAMVRMKQACGLVTNCDALSLEKLIRSLDRK